MRLGISNKKNKNIVQYRENIEKIKGSCPFLYIGTFVVVKRYSPNIFMNVLVNQNFINNLPVLCRTDE